METTMRSITKILLALSAFATLCLASTASATIIGEAVDDFDTPTPVGNLVNRPALGGAAAIEYYIPLTSNPSRCWFGVNCGTASDSGFGGTLMGMNLLFENLVPNAPATLNVLFEDLDLVGATDHLKFLEEVRVFSSDGSSYSALTPWITEINQILPNGTITGNQITQQLLSVDLGVLTGTTYYATLGFQAEWQGRHKVWNTPEYLIASIHQEVPEPSILALLGIGILGMVGARKLKKH